MIDKIKSKVEILNLIFKVIYLLHLCFCFTIFGAGNIYTLISVLLIAFILILYRIINIKIYINYTNTKILLFFLLSYILSSLIYSKYGIFENIQCFSWMFIQFLLLYTFDINQEKKNVLKEFKIISATLISFLTITNLYNLVLLVSKYSSFFKAPSGDIYIIGVSTWGRLYGIFTDPNYCSVLSIVGIMLSIYLFRISKSKYIKIANIFCIIVQFLFISFAGSRTALVAMMVGISLYCFLLGIQKFNKKKIIKSALITIFVCFSIYVSFKGIVYGYNKLNDFIQEQQYSKVETIENNVNQENEQDIENIKEEDNTKESSTNKKNKNYVGRENNIKNDISNRRFDIWKSGFEIFKKVWLTGISYRNIVPYTLENFPNTYIVNNDFAIFNAFHNVIIDCLIAQGILGFIIILYFGIKTLIHITKNLGKINKEGLEHIYVLISICITIGVSAMFLSHILYVNSPTTYMFWLCLGYIVFLIQNKKGE